METGDGESPEENPQSRKGLLPHCLHSLKVAGFLPIPWKCYGKKRRTVNRAEEMFQKKIAKVQRTGTQSLEWLDLNRQQKNSTVHYKVRMQEVQPEQTSYKRQVLGCIVSRFNEKKRSFFFQKSGRFQFWFLPELVKCRCTLQIYFSRCCWKLPRSIIVRLLFHGCLLQLPEIPKNCPKSAIFGNHCMTSLSNIDTFWVGTFWLRDLSCLSLTFGK